MSRYPAGSIGNNWQKYEDGGEPLPPTVFKKPLLPPVGEELWRFMAQHGLDANPFLVLCVGDDGAILNTMTYHPRDEELAKFAYDLNKAALEVNPNLLAAGTVQVELKRGERVIRFARAITVDAEAA